MWPLLCLIYDFNWTIYIVRKCRTGEHLLQYSILSVFVLLAHVILFIVFISFCIRSSFMIWFLIASFVSRQNRCQLFPFAVHCDCFPLYSTPIQFRFFFYFVFAYLYFFVVLFIACYAQTFFYIIKFEREKLPFQPSYFWCQHRWILWNSLNNRKITHCIGLLCMRRCIRSNTSETVNKVNGAAGHTTRLPAIACGFSVSFGEQPGFYTIRLIWNCVRGIWQSQYLHTFLSRRCC